ncbi:hypothetical protein DOTSEDRAFT_74601 [Dothistroma septosporum NZE10]|uniref:Uncharacterized protein n=1 Tax=Dothistroma septosporum (strain NZE10 / CBS 128990) TaxID=675120 RepID=N1PEQ9_DOTSN|nr:hypothetical protein DOTSEDRAFT_74601 [Dothistroma septosporum NZE10]
MDSEVPLHAAYDAPPFLEESEGFFSTLEEPSEMRSSTVIDGYPHIDGYYWFGKLYLRCLLAEIVLRDTKVPLQGRAIDV